MDTVIVGATEVAHLSKSNGENGRIDGELMLNREAHVTDNLAIHIKDGIIVKFSSNEEMIHEWGLSSKSSREVNYIDVHGAAIVPGFVDAHTHLLWDYDSYHNLNNNLLNSYHQVIQKRTHHPHHWATT